MINKFVVFNSPEAGSLLWDIIELRICSSLQVSHFRMKHTLIKFNVRCVHIVYAWLNNNTILVLAAGSAVFDALFYGGIASRENEIKLPDVEHQAFLGKIFVYKGYHFKRQKSHSTLIILRENQHDCDTKITKTAMNALKMRIFV